MYRYYWLALFLFPIGCESSSTSETSLHSKWISSVECSTSADSIYHRDRLTVIGDRLGKPRVMYKDEVQTYALNGFDVETKEYVYHRPDKLTIRAYLVTHDSKSIESSVVEFNDETLEFTCREAGRNLAINKKRALR
jgi:hypothetical protein